ncbi:uncharacterized protein LOC135475277 [Liolophura sinensis]|uniref:uncharacterized protein LOC135475277 n=1 Tax=Liolophura sinensis TaxID=3198878 RepID=UPI0031590463
MKRRSTRSFSPAQALETAEEPVETAHSQRDCKLKTNNPKPASKRGRPRKAPFEVKTEDVQNTDAAKVLCSESSIKHLQKEDSEIVKTEEEENVEDMKKENVAEKDGNIISSVVLSDQQTENDKKLPNAIIENNQPMNSEDQEVKG